MSWKRLAEVLYCLIVLDHDIEFPFLADQIFCLLRKCLICSIVTVSLRNRSIRNLRWNDFHFLKWFVWHGVEARAWLLLTLGVDRLGELVCVEADEHFLIPWCLLGVLGIRQHFGNVLCGHRFARVVLLEPVKFTIANDHHNINIALVRDFSALFL